MQLSHRSGTQYDLAMSDTPPFCQDFQRSLVFGRRSVLKLGALGSLSLPGLWASQAAANSRTANGFGRAKRCIFLFMWGGPSQLDTFDMKPDAPSEIRGEFKPIATKTPGLMVCEHFHRVANMSKRIAVVRSLSHDDPAHLSSGHTTVTGHLPPVNKSDAEPPSENDSPHFGSVMSHLRPADLALPTFVMLPWKVLHPAAPGGVAPGQHGGWLGRQYNPFIVEGDPSSGSWQAPSLALSDDVTLNRLNDRRRLLSSLDQVRREMDSPLVDQTAHLEQRAFELLASGKVRAAFDLTQEPDAVRDRYGRNTHGQCVLLARRLLEHGVPIVNVNWHQDRRNFWDTHGNNFVRLKRDLIPPADMALTSLLSDLGERGMLDDTLVVWVGEFGRNPKINAKSAGREHWPYCYSALLAGGGVQGGTVFGKSDSHAAFPSENAVSPHDLMTTVYHALGIPSMQLLYDQLQRPHSLYAGNPITALF